MKRFLFCIVFMVFCLTGCSNIATPSVQDLVDGVLVEDSQDCFSYNMSYNIDLLLDLDMIIDKAQFTELDSKGILPVSVSSDMSYYGNAELANVRGFRQVTYPEQSTKKILNSWYVKDSGRTVVYESVDNNWNKIFTDEVFDWFLNFSYSDLSNVVLQDTSLSDVRYVVTAKIDWYGLNNILHLDDSVDDFKDIGVDLNDVVFALKFEYDTETYKLRSLEVTLDSSVDMTGRSLIFDGFVLNLYPDYPDDISDLELPDDIVASCEEESEVIETEVDNTIKINMMAVNPDGISGEVFMSKVRDYFSLSDVECRTFAEYDIASTSYKDDGYSLKLGIQVFRGSKTAEEYMLDANEEFYMNYLSEYFEGEVVNKSEGEKIYVYSVGKFNPVEIHMKSGNAVISITGSTDEGVSSDEMFEKINGFIELLESEG